MLPHYDRLGVPYEEWDTATLERKVPIFDVHEFWPPSRPSDDDFAAPRAKKLPGAIYTPDSGYVNDPALSSHNLQRAAEAKGGQFLYRRKVTEIRQAGGKVLGVTLDDGSEIDAKIVVNVAGPHSFVINRMAGVEDGMKIKTKALRHEVHHVPSPPGFDYEKDGHHVSDGDNAIYFRPETGNHILIGSEDPDCDPQVWVENPDDFNRQVTREQWEAQVYRCARRIPALPIPEEMKGVVDLYDCSDDWIPIYDKSDLGGFYMAVGTSGNQFKNGPVVGHCMAELIDAVEKGHDHDSDPVKVTARYTGERARHGRSTRACARSTRTARSRSMASVAPWLHVRRGAEAVEYYKAAFGAVVLHRHENDSGEIVAQLAIGDAVFWVADDADHSPDFLGGGTARFILTRRRSRRRVRTGHRRRRHGRQRDVRGPRLADRAPDRPGRPDWESREAARLSRPSQRPRGGRAGTRRSSGSNA